MILVYTHNPWGEYGHPEHVQVSRVICDLARKNTFQTWFFGYTAHETIHMMESKSYLLDSNISLIKTNQDLYAQIKSLYDRFNCWTYYPDYFPPRYEIFYKYNPDNSPSEIIKRPLTVNYIALPSKEN